MSDVNVLRQFAGCQKVVTETNYAITNDVPIGLKESWVETVKSRALILVHCEDRFPNFRCRKFPQQQIVWALIMIVLI